MIFRKQLESQDIPFTNCQRTGSFSGRVKLSSLDSGCWVQFRYTTLNRSTCGSFHPGCWLSSFISHPSPNVPAAMIVLSKQQMGRYFPKEHDCKQLERKGLKLLISRFLLSEPKMTPKKCVSNACPHMQKSHLAFDHLALTSVGSW